MSVIRDERVVAVQNASYKWAFTFLLFALLVDVICRGLLRHEAAWDLMALVIVSSGLSTVYQAWQRVLPISVAVLGVCLAAVVGAFVSALYTFHLLH
jgi:hypothetical protein